MTAHEVTYYGGPRDGMKERVNVNGNRIRHIAGTHRDDAAPTGIRADDDRPLKLRRVVDVYEITEQGRAVFLGQEIT